MLVHLSIKNYALIEDLQVSFQKGFTTITGETGAGKSIFLESLALVLGKRADRSALRDDSGKCIVEATFDIAQYGAVKEFFEQESLEYEDHTIIRREIHPNGKSRAFINDSPVTLNILTELGTMLIDIHSQHQTLELTEHNFQLRVVDALAGNDDLLKKYDRERRLYLNTLKELEKLKASREEALKEKDYTNFLLEELRAADLRPGIQEELEEQQAQLENAKEIINLLSGSAQMMNDEQYGLLSLLIQLRQNFSKLSSYGTHFKELHERIQSLYLEAEDIFNEIEIQEGNQTTDPELLEKVTSSLQILYQLQQKHKVDSIAELTEKRNALEEAVAYTLDVDSTIERLEREETKLTETLKILTGQLHANRKKVLPELKANLESQLKTLGIPNANFQMNLVQLNEFTPTGNDKFQLLFTANKGGQHGELKKTASGGELSRIMLCVKAILARYEALPTMMFDEIDTGVSGEISNKMGDIMQEMSAYMQIFAITHLPQVASKGRQQFKVYKEDGTDRTHTRMRLLDQEERIVELAEMLGGKSVTDAALVHARQLLN